MSQGKSPIADPFGLPPLPAADAFGLAPLTAASDPFGLAPEPAAAPPAIGNKPTGEKTAARAVPPRRKAPVRSPSLIKASPAALASPDGAGLQPLPGDGLVPLASADGAWDPFAPLSSGDPLLVADPLAAPAATPAPASPNADWKEEPLWLFLRACPPFAASMLAHLAVVVTLAMFVIKEKSSGVIALRGAAGQDGGSDQLQLLEEAASLYIPETANPLQSALIAKVDDVSGLAGAKLDVSLDTKELEAAIEKTKLEEFRLPTIQTSLTSREVQKKETLIKEYGGSQVTEAAVLKGLAWLARNQSDDGSWSLTGDYADGAKKEDQAAATGFALLAFQGAGHTHRLNPDLPTDYSKVVGNGWSALLKMQQPSGRFQAASGNAGSMYTHAICTIAACEIYGMTQDKQFLEPAEKALKFAIDAQAETGGWRYAPKQGGDMSVTGWYAMALQSAQMAGLKVPSDAFVKLTKFLDDISHEERSKYSYEPGTPATHVLTAEGLLCRQYLGWKRNDPRMRKGVEYLLANPLQSKRRNTYYWYYGTQVMHHLGGEPWRKWNGWLRAELPPTQIRVGAERGSWSPAGDAWSEQGGRLYTTCLCLFMLESYYRHTPIYHKDNGAAEPIKADT
jgi:hypothetical protein